MIDAYTRLHRCGYAHSVEAWFEGKLAGGLYGVSLGNAFFGESMFTRKSNASKVALAALVQHMQEENFSVLDCQLPTGHLVSLGAREISRRDYLAVLKRALREGTKKGTWSLRR
jgi:leucyl/phenylalanyl-tRNA--protein transferase